MEYTKEQIKDMQQEWQAVKQVWESNGFVFDFDGLRYKNTFVGKFEHYQIKDLVGTKIDELLFKRGIIEFIKPNEDRFVWSNDRILPINTLSEVLEHYRFINIHNKNESKQNECFFSIKFNNQNNGKNIIDHENIYGYVITNAFIKDQHDRFCCFSNGLNPSIELIQWDDYFFVGVNSANLIGCGRSVVRKQDVIDFLKQ